MNDAFTMKVRSAAAAGWWTLLIAAAVLSVQWVGYLWILSAKPAWLLALWGPDVGWATVQTVWLWAVAVFKVCVWVLALVTVWLTLWGRRLARA